MVYKCNFDRMQDKITTMSKYGDAGHGGVTRYCFSEADLQARREFKKRMESIGAEIKTDDIGNVYARLKGSDPSLPAIVTGSHTDSVKNGGNYDGILGVIAAMEVLETIVEKKIPHRHDIVAMIWTNEEGSLYPPAMMSSGIVMNEYLPENIAKNFKFDNMMNSKSVLDSSKTFKEALDNSGYKGDIKNRLNPKDYSAMFEMHIEQGPILEAENNDIGVVTCPQYLEFTSEVYKREDGRNFVCSPPMKGQESQDALWHAIKNGMIDTVATDHCPFQSYEKDWGKDDFTKIPNGCAGVENLYPYMLDAANRGKISFERAVELCSTNVAKIFGCDSKGSLTVGKDADIVIYDPKKEFTITIDKMHTDCDHTIWEGRKLQGYPVQTYLRGQLIYDNEEFLGKPGMGKFIKRSPRKYS